MQIGLVYDLAMLNYIVLNYAKSLVTNLGTVIDHD